MRQWTILLFLVHIQLFLSGQTKNWEHLTNHFIQEYQALNLTGLRIAYVDNLQNIGKPAELQKQYQVFTNILSELNQIDKEALLELEKLEFDLITYYATLNLERIALASNWHEYKHDSISTQGLASIRDGQKWYLHFLKHWIDQTVTIDELYQLGLKEIKRVHANMQQVQVASGKDLKTFQEHIDEDSFYYTDVQSVQAAFESYAKQIQPILAKAFPEIMDIPNAAIQRGNLPRLAQVPGYYSRGTFYYNYFEQPYNKRQIAWIYLHEAMPGHHYEISYRSKVSQSKVLSLFYSPSFSEGWAAYVEDLALEIGLYPTLYDELGKWEWDIIRSVRVVLDIGLNYYHWSDAKALEFWNQFIPNQEDIAHREIARMKRWPCQVITYKYGAVKLLAWKQQFEQQPDFDLLEFHRDILAYGPIPFSILEKLIHPFQK